MIVSLFTSVLRTTLGRVGSGLLPLVPTARALPAPINHRNRRSGQRPSGDGREAVNSAHALGVGPATPGTSLRLLADSSGGSFEFCEQIARKTRTLRTDEDVNADRETQRRRDAGEVLGRQPCIDSGLRQCHSAQTRRELTPEGGNGLQRGELDRIDRSRPSGFDGLRINTTFLEDPLDQRKHLGTPFRSILCSQYRYELGCGHASKTVLELVSHASGHDVRPTPR
jgi:hypothetical protein